MGSCYSNDRFADTDREHHVLLGNHHRSMALERSVIDYWEALACFTVPKPRPLLLLKFSSTKTTTNSKHNIKHLTSIFTYFLFLLQNRKGSIVVSYKGIHIASIS